jgi:hypothetical protein
LFMVVQQNLSSIWTRLASQNGRIENLRKLSSRNQWAIKRCITKSIGILGMSQLLHLFQPRERVWSHTLWPLKTHYVSDKN